MDTVYIVEYRESEIANWQTEMIYHLKHDAEYYMANMKAMNPGIYWQVKEYKVI